MTKWNKLYFTKKSLKFPYFLREFFMAQLRFRTPSGIPFYPTHYISHALIVISVIIAVLGFLFPFLKSYFWLHAIPVYLDTLPFIFGQVALYQFLHEDVLHIFMNAYFLYSAGPEVESRMTRREFLLFFLGNTIFVAVALWLLSSGLTIGISGFCMALLSYLYMELQSTRHPMANQILIMLVINILIGLTGNISFVGHAAGALWGMMWWMIKKK